MKQSFKQFIIIPALLFCIYPVWGGHIIGGNMTYKCLGNNEYEFTLLMYRDCNCTNCADFDQNVSIGLFRCGNNINCSELNQSDRIISISVPLNFRFTILNPDVPGFQFSEHCLEAGEYSFRLTLPVNAENYYVAYQRCCRPETVSNIPNPRTVGMTIFSEIKSNAAAGCNNSPIFQESISPVFCLGETFDIDHSAIDSDGDSLVYSICSAFKGAGLAGGPEMPGASATACNGLTPNPACPPPYDFVDYASGFSGTNPLGSDSQLSIHPQTGLITVNPSIVGQFLVTVCVKEYRNGLLINDSHREFTYLAAACQTTSTSENLKHSGLKLFPNPAHNSIQIIIRDQRVTSNQIHIFNSYGQMIQRLDNVENQSVDISGWPSGLYNVILLQNSKVVQTEKFVKIQ